MTSNSPKYPRKEPSSVPKEKPAFSAKLMPEATKLAGGFSSGGEFCLASIADEVFDGAPSGAMLACYMIRRFGWPNAGSDDEKNLCEWDITTPVPGLFLSVTPYMGPSNLHFGIRYTSDVGDKLMQDPGRTSFQNRKKRAIRRWWDSIGRTLYHLGGLTPEAAEKRTLVHRYNEARGKTWGLWERGKFAIQKTPLPAGKKFEILYWWLGEFIRKNHPSFKLPKMTARERAHRESAFHRRVKDAIRTTMLDMLRPVAIRDISISAFGDIEREPEAMKRDKGQPRADRFAGAGYAPRYWFKNRKRILASKP
jgi:hypothetical protein